MTLRDHVLKELIGGLWHTTHPDRFRSILNESAILPEPNLPDSERWGTAAGTEFHPYVRSLGAISLFDFEDFDPDSYSEKCPSSSWAYFVPYRRDWSCAVWIEIDRTKVGAPQFISGAELWAKHRAENAVRRIMPYIEAAYIGSLPRSAFKRAFLVRKEQSALLPYDLNTGALLPCQPLACVEEKPSLLEQVLEKSRKADKA